MLGFKEFLFETSVDGFMSKVASCQTVEGLKELENYYRARSKEVELKPSDDISMRDALAGRHAEIKAAKAEEEDDF